MKKITTKMVLSAAIFLSTINMVSANTNAHHSPLTPLPTTCINSVFTSTGGSDWKNMSLKLTNNCNRPIDFQNATVTFKNKVNLNTNFWGNFDPLPYPDSNTQITSQPSGSEFLASLHLHFPSYPGASSILPVGKSFTILYGVSKDQHDGNASVYVGGDVATGSIQLTNGSLKPSDVSAAYVIAHIVYNGTTITNVQLPWNSRQSVAGIAPGTYSVTSDNVTGSTGKLYQAVVTPTSVNVAAGQTANATIIYSAPSQHVAMLNLQLQSLPSELSGYTGKPNVQVTETGTSSSTQVGMNWGAITNVPHLIDGGNYTFSTPAIGYNGYTCQPTFQPASLTAKNTLPVPLSHLTYTCVRSAQSNVTLSVKGAPTTLGSLKVQLTPNNGTGAITQTVALANGTGTTTAVLTTGTVYNVSSDPVTGYSVKFDPQPFTATNGAVETITLTQQATGTPVAINGQLKVCGTHLCNEQGQEIQLKGMSSHGIQWYGWQGSNTEKACLTTASLDNLTNNWGASVMRISMYIQEGGYETNPAAFTAQVNQLIDEATKRGIYAIVDWHMLTPGDPNVNLAKAKTFFTAIATAHKNNNNLLYEIANEPNGVSWASIKSYAEQLIPVIRAIDNKTVILIGTRAWSSLGVSDGATSQEIINSPVNFTNIMYTFHFYAASHGDIYYNEVDRASNVLPIFVTEFGSQTYTGGGANNFTMTDKYLDLFARKKISWTNWNYSDDQLSGAVWKTGTCSNGPWTDNNLKEAGVYIKGKIKN